MIESKDVVRFYQQITSLYRQYSLHIQRLERWRNEATDSDTKKRFTVEILTYERIVDDLNEVLKL